MRSVLVLGIDTATQHASIGLREGDRVLAEYTEKNHASHAVSLLPLIERVLNEGHMTIGDVDAIAVSHGPGSFTGLRIGVSVAKGLACATGARVVGVSTLEALARSVPRRGTICSLLDARKGEVYAAWFEGGPARLRRVSEDAVLSHEMLLAVLPTPCVIAGDAERAYGAVVRSRFGAEVEFLSFDEFGPRGSVVAMLGAEALCSDNADDPVGLEPVYIRPSEAERQAR